MHVLPVARREHDAPMLVKRTQPNPVFLVERLLTHRHEYLLLPLPRAVLVLRWRRRVRPEPCALLGHDGTVALEEHEHERLELREVRSIRRVSRRGHLVIDRREEVVRGEVLWQLRRVAEILRLCRADRDINGRVQGEEEGVDVPARDSAAPIRCTRLRAPHYARPGRGSRMACMRACPKCPCVASRK
jgi:hypothetical protein